MEIEKIAMPRKRRLVAALIIFLVTSLAAVILNSFMMGYGL